jgi:hypothetical protein
MADKQINRQAAMNLLGNLIEPTRVDSPAGRSYLRVENKLELSVSYFGVQVGNGTEGKPGSMIMPFSNDDLPMSYILERSPYHGCMEASIVVEDDTDRASIISVVSDMLREVSSNNDAEVYCSRVDLANPRAWRISMYTKSMLQEEFIPILDKIEERFGEATKLTEKDMAGITEFLRKNRQ